MDRLRSVGRDLRIVGRMVWLNLALYAALLFAAAGLMQACRSYPRASYYELVVASFQMSHLESWAEPGDGPLPALLTFLVPALTAVILGEGVLRVGAIYLYRDQHREEWDRLLVQTFADHTVICGAGELGRAIYRHLIARDPHSRIVLVDTRPLVPAELGPPGDNVCMLQADMTLRATLEAAGCPRAALIILASGDDATNLEAGLKALELNPQAEIWIRLYRSNLASLMDCAARPNIHFFSPYEQAAAVLVSQGLGPKATRGRDEAMK